MSKQDPKVLFIRFGAIGNALAAVPAMRAMRRAWPNASFTLAGDPLTLELLGTCPYIDEFIRYDQSGPEKAGPGYARFIMKLRRRGFTHAVCFRRYLRSELIGFLSGAPARMGFGTEAGLRFLTKKVEYEEGVNVIELNLRLARGLGVEAFDRSLEYWPSQGSPRVEEVLAALEGNGPLVVIHPGGATQQRRLWPGFGELAGWLRARLMARVVMIGARPEKGVVEKAAGSISPPAAAAVGWPLPEVAELIQMADLFAGTDSGPAHLADAVGTPGAILYAPHRGLSDQIKKWKPEGPRYIAFTPPRDCRHCPEDPCSPSRQHQCAASISVQEVGAGMERLYADKSGKD